MACARPCDKFYTCVRVTDERTKAPAESLRSGSTAIQKSCSLMSAHTKMRCSTLIDLLSHHDANQCSFHFKPRKRTDPHCMLLKCARGKTTADAIGVSWCKET
jgi:hypothetical protein